MSLLDLITELRAESVRHARRTRYRGQAEYLEDKQAHCRRIDAIADRIMRQFGTDNPRAALSLGPCVVGARVVPVVTRADVSAARAAAEALFTLPATAG